MTRYFELLREPTQTVKIRNSAGGPVVYCDRDATQDRAGKTQRDKYQIARFHRSISAIVVRATSATPAYEKPSQLVGLCGSGVHARCPVGYLVLPKASDFVRKSFL